MPKPLGYFACARAGTSDAVRLTEIEQQFGSYLEKLSVAELAAWIAKLVSEAVKLQGVESEPDNCNLELLSSLSDGTKLNLATAALSYLQERNYLGKQETMANANLC